MAMHHEHSAVRESDARCFSGPVACDPNRENRAAHGGIEVTEFCSCGASRAVLRNGMHHEAGPWSDREE
jgi:hypothetical protein